MKPDIEDQIKCYLSERGWDNLRPVDIAKSISIEAAELLEIFQWSNQSLQEVKADSKQLEQISGELADVLIYALDMAVLLQIDVATIITDKLEKVRQKYPAELMKQSQSAEPGTDSTYLRIKADHRHRAKNQ